MGELDTRVVARNSAPLIPIKRLTVGQQSVSTVYMGINTNIVCPTTLVSGYGEAEMELRSHRTIDPRIPLDCLPEQPCKRSTQRKIFVESPGNLVLSSVVIASVMLSD